MPANYSFYSYLMAYELSVQCMEQWVGFDFYSMELNWDKGRESHRIKIEVPRTWPQQQHISYYQLTHIHSQNITQADSVVHTYWALTQTRLQAHKLSHDHTCTVSTRSRQTCSNTVLHFYAVIITHRYIPCFGHMCRRLHTLTHTHTPKLLIWPLQSDGSGIRPAN